MEIKLPFGLRGNTILHISEVEAGLACNCVCPSCYHPLVAKKGRKNVEHFAHYGGSTCKYSVETALHLAAKQILESEKKIRLPKVTVNFGSFKKPWIVYKERTITFDTVELERRIDDVVPDILVSSKDTPLIIEIVVTHAIDERKRQKLSALGISALEISLYDFLKNPASTELKEELIHSTKQKRWLFNAKAAAVKKNINRLAGRKKHIRQGLALYVPNCPLYPGESKNSRANVVKDCLYCKYCLDAGLDSREDFVLCSGNPGINTYQDYLRVL